MRAPEAKAWLAELDVLVERLAGGSAGEVAALCGLGRAKLDALEARVLAEASGGDVAAAQRIAGGDKARTKRSARRAAKRAAAVKKNRKLADGLADGTLSTDQVDAVADASAKPGPGDGSDAARDDELIDQIADAPADRAKSLVDAWHDRRADAAEQAARRARQRRRRGVRRYYNERRGLDGVAIEGDRESIDQIMRSLAARERELYEADGGRDLPASEHQRTRDQRSFDAAHHLITGLDPTTGSGGRGGCNRTRVQSRAWLAAVLNVPASVLFGELDGPGTATAVGDGPIPNDVIAQALVDHGLIFNITDYQGQTLNWGRTTRHADLEQFLALVIRDRGCVRCGADWSKTQAHHLMPWNAPGQGTTDLDTLALLCGPCHHDLHATNHTLIRNKHGTWTTRPATTHETPPQPARRATTPHSHDPP